MFYRLEFRNLIQKWLSFANCKLPLMKWIEINLVTWMNQSLYSQHFGEFFFLWFFFIWFFSLVTYQWYIANSNLLYVKLNCSCIHLFIYSQWCLDFIHRNCWNLSFWKYMTCHQTHLFIEKFWCICWNFGLLSVQIYGSKMFDTR